MKYWKLFFLSFFLSFFSVILPHQILKWLVTGKEHVPLESDLLSLYFSFTTEYCSIVAKFLYFPLSWSSYWQNVDNNTFLTDPSYTHTHKQKHVGKVLRTKHICYLVIFDSLQPNGLQPTRLFCPWDSPGKITRVGCHFLLQGISMTQGVYAGLPWWLSW